MEAGLTCGHCGESGRLTLAREKDSLEWKGETLMHTECGAMGEPMDVLTIPLWPLPRPLPRGPWKRDWLWQANDEEEMFRSVEDDLDG